MFSAFGVLCWWIELSSLGVMLICSACSTFSFFVVCDARMFWDWKAIILVGARPRIQPIIEFHSELASYVKMSLRLVSTESPRVGVHMHDYRSKSRLNTRNQMGLNIQVKAESHLRSTRYGPKRLQYERTGIAHNKTMKQVLSSDSEQTTATAVLLSLVLQTYW